MGTVTFRVFVTWPRCSPLKGHVPNTCCKHLPALSRKEQSIPGLSIQESTEKPVWKAQQIASVLTERTSLRSCVSDGFQEESSFIHLGTSPCYTETKIQLGLQWCTVFWSRRARISSVALKCLSFTAKLLLYLPKEAKAEVSRDIFLFPPQQGRSVLHFTSNQYPSGHEWTLGVLIVPFL